MLKKTMRWKRIEGRQVRNKINEYSLIKRKMHGQLFVNSRWVLYCNAYFEAETTGMFCLPHARRPERLTI